MILSTLLVQSKLCHNTLQKKKTWPIWIKKKKKKAYKNHKWTCLECSSRLWDLRIFPGQLCPKRWTWFLLCWCESRVGAPPLPVWLQTRFGSVVGIVSSTNVIKVSKLHIFLTAIISQVDNNGPRKQSSIISSWKQVHQFHTFYYTHFWLSCTKYLQQSKTLYSQKHSLSDSSQNCRMAYYCRSHSNAPDSPNWKQS